MTRSFKSIVLSVVLGLLPLLAVQAQYNGFQQPGYPSFPNQSPTILPNQPTYRPPVTPQQVTGASTTAGTHTPWFLGLVKDRDHDFGTVARASTQQHVFEFVNNTEADLFLVSVRASCGCTKPAILTPQIKPGETGQVSAKFDTLNFYGQRGATVSVVVRKSGTPAHTAEVQLSVKGRIRRDVVLTPGEFKFHDAVVDQSIRQTAKVLYAGKPDWKILDVKSTNPNITAETRELERIADTGRVTYEMVVSVSDSQTGVFSDTLTIITNDPKTNGMPVAVAGNIKPQIEVSPITLGVVNEGQKIAKKLIIRSPKPIQIQSVETDNPKIKFQPIEGKKTLHIISYTLDTSEPCEIEEDIVLRTMDDDLRETRVPFSVQVVPATITSDQQD